MQRGTRNDRNPNAPTCEDLHQQWTQHCEEQARVAAWELHNIIYKFAKRVKKTKTRSKNKLLQKLSPGQKPASKKKNEKVDSGASMHLINKSNHIPRAQETIPKSKESCTNITRNGTITATEEATVYVKDLDMVQFLEHSPAVLSLGEVCAK